MNISSLEARYLDSCKRHEVQPNSTVLSWFSEAKIQNLHHGKCSMVVSLTQLKDVDIPPLINVFMEIESSNIDAIDILHESHGVLSEEKITALIHAINPKLRVLDLLDMSLRKDFLWDICWRGLACEVLNLRSLHIRKLNMVGRFMRLHTLNLDFCTSLTSLHKDCFSCMPNLMRLSICETRVSNLWTTTAALSKLPSLVELRFQNCLCCKDTGPCPASSGENHVCERTGLAQMNVSYHGEAPSTDSENATYQYLGTNKAIGNLHSLDDSNITSEIQSRTDNLLENGEVKLSSYLRGLCLLELSSTDPPLNGQAKLQNKIRKNALLGFTKLMIRK